MIVWKIFFLIFKMLEYSHTTLLFVVVSIQFKLHCIQVKTFTTDLDIALGKSRPLSHIQTAHSILIKKLQKILKFIAFYDSGICMDLKLKSINNI